MCKILEISIIHFTVRYKIVARFFGVSAKPQVGGSPEQEVAEPTGLMRSTLLQPQAFMEHLDNN